MNRGIKYLLLILLLFVFHTNLINAQNSTDSLELVLEFTPDSEKRIDILLLLSEKLKENNTSKALKYSLQAVDLSETLQNNKYLLKSKLSVSEIYCTQSNYKQAINYVDNAKALAKALDDKTSLAKSYQLAGLIYSNLGDYNESSSLYFKSLKLYEQTNDKKNIGRALRSIASIYFDQKNYDKALDYYFRAQNIAKEINDQEVIALGLNDIAAIYGFRKQYDKVIKYLKESVEINKKLNNKRAVSINYTNIGVVNQRLNNYDTAIYYLNKAKMILIELDDELSISNLNNIISQFYFSYSKKDSALYYAKKAYNTGVKYGMKKVVFDAANILYNIYIDKGDTAMANEYLIQYYQIKDSMNIEKSTIQLSKLEMLHELEREKTIRQIQQQKRVFILFLIIISLVLGLSVIILLFVRYKIKAQNAELEKFNLKKELEFKNKELALKVMSLLKKNEILSNISKKLIDIKKEAVKSETKIAINKIYKELQKSTDDEIWEEFELRFKQVHSEFYKKLMNDFPDLSPSEQRLCAFLRLNMSSKEISELTGQSLNALETARYRLRKKLGISNSQVNLITFLSQL